MIVVGSSGQNGDAACELTGLSHHAKELALKKANLLDSFNIDWDLGGGARCSRQLPLHFEAVASSLISKTSPLSSYRRNTLISTPLAP